MYMSCTCLAIIYMLLIYSLSIYLELFSPTMYMFVQNSKKKITPVISALQKIIIRNKKFLCKKTCNIMFIY